MAGKQGSNIPFPPLISYLSQLGCHKAKRKPSCTSATRDCKSRNHQFHPTLNEIIVFTGKNTLTEFRQSGNEGIDILKTGSPAGDKTTIHQVTDGEPLLKDKVLLQKRYRRLVQENKLLIGG